MRTLFHTFLSGWFRSAGFVFMLGLGICLAGCSSSDNDEPETGGVEFCNYDQFDYDIELRRTGDDSLVRTLTLHAGDSGDPTCAYREDIRVGTYYVDAYYADDGSWGDGSVDFIVSTDSEPVVFINSLGDMGVVGGGVSGTGDITVCNGDNEEYIVELRREEDGSVYDSFDLDDIDNIFDFDEACDTFDDVDAGAYYLVIYEEGNFDNSSTSVIFFIEDDDYESFRIDSTGDIVRE